MICCTVALSFSFYLFGYRKKHLLFDYFELCSFSVHAVLLGEKVTSVFEYAIRTLSRMEDVEHTRYLACYIFRYAPRTL